MIVRNRERVPKYRFEFESPHQTQIPVGGGEWEAHPPIMNTFTEGLTNKVVPQPIYVRLRQKTGLILLSLRQEILRYLFRRSGQVLAICRKH